MRILVHTKTFLLLAALLPLPALGIDGLVEINQAKALAGGVTASDAPGFPVTLDAQGSYVLTSNLVVLANDTDAIRAVSPDITIDLRGFVVTGPGDCSGMGGSLTCISVGLGRGIWSNQPRTTVRGGAVRGFGSVGVRLDGELARVEDVVSDVNGAGGISVGVFGTVVGSVADRNRGPGIAGSTGSTVTRSVGNHNFSEGINCGCASVTGSRTYQNGSTGIFASGSNISGNDSVLNGGDGIVAGDSSTVEGNSSAANVGHGITANTASLIRGNVSNNNGGNGINLTHGTSGYRENVVKGNTGGTIGGGVDLGDNLCNGSKTCP